MWVVYGYGYYFQGSKLNPFSARDAIRDLRTLYVHCLDQYGITVMDKASANLTVTGGSQSKTSLYYTIDYIVKMPFG